MNCFGLRWARVDVAPTLACLLAVMVFSPAGAQTLFYDQAGNPGWFADDAWSGVSQDGPFDTNWVDDRFADLGGASPTGTRHVDLGGNTARVTGLSRATGITRLHSGTLVFTNATLTQGSMRLDLPARGNLTLQDGMLEFFGDTAGWFDDFGHLTLSGGNVRMGFNNNIEVTVTLAGLSGSSGTITPRALSGNDAQPVQTLIVNQAVDTVFAAQLLGVGEASNQTNYLQVTKSGVGDLALTGTIDPPLRKTTTIDGGALLVNTVNATFGDGDGNTAILVAAGGTLGGSGSIVTLPGDDVMVADGGHLLAGTRTDIGTTTYAFGAGAALDLSNVLNATEWLQFTLGSDATPGVSYDRIVLSSGSLNIGDGLLNIEDFAITQTNGFGLGVYTLFSAPSITGTLGAKPSGRLGDFNGTLSVSGTELLLEVTPATGTTILLR